ncbi:high affinity immunoglobulin gamma Fc receptor I-like [Tachysurus vachellii]|nr:high affinity immunoglobulin gamma Fc receptor I-like [Tachysurus vachellii]XP_060730940.1 high affinity immunoglobulin gamma Fc receptor I-like [Tachysurus vachellii]
MMTMHFFHSFMVFVTWLAVARLEEPQFKAKATVSSGHQQLFSGEDVQLTCSVPDDPSSSWKYQWFHDGVSLGFTTVYSIKKARVQQSGSYTCQGQKAITTHPYTQSSVLSDPLKIHVDGGWILLQYSVEPLIEEPLTLTCRVRDDRLISGVIFYKDGIKIKTQKNPDLVFPSLSFEDDGMYSCRATWLKNLDYQSAQSVPNSVAVLEKLETPRMVLLTDPNQVTIGKQVVFRCITKVNTREQGVSIEYLYIKDDKRLERPSAKDTYIITRVSKEDAGSYTCKVSVKALNVERWSNHVQLEVQLF